MLHLPIYINETDLGNLSDWLNAEEDIAIISSTGNGKWQAFDSVQLISSGRYCFYHKLSGALPLLGNDSSDYSTLIPDPFAGWADTRKIINSPVPWFGAGWPGIFWLDVRTLENEKIGLSSFSWIGNHYSLIGRPAPVVCIKWWNRLRRWVIKNTTKIPRTGAIDGEDKDIYAFESALTEIKAGKPRHMNPHVFFN